MIELAISERGAVDYYIAVYLVFPPAAKKTGIRAKIQEKFYYFCEN